MTGISFTLAVASVKLGIGNPVVAQNIALGA